MPASDSLPLSDSLSLFLTLLLSPTPSRVCVCEREYLFTILCVCVVWSPHVLLCFSGFSASLPPFSYYLSSSSVPLCRSLSLSIRPSVLPSVRLYLRDRRPSFRLSVSISIAIFISLALSPSRSISSFPRRCRPEEMDVDAGQRGTVLNDCNVEDF